MSFAVNKSQLLKSLGSSRWTAFRFSSSQINKELSTNDKETKIKPEELEKHELEVVIKHGKNGQYMDRVWETSIVYHGDKAHYQISDPYFVAHNRLNSFVESAITYHEWGLNSDAQKRRMKNLIDYREENQQKYYPRRHANLGPDLSVSHMVIARGGKVKFEHDSEVWATSLNHFPRKYNPIYKVIEINASHLKLKYEAIDNFQELDSLRSLNLSSNRLDDWCCDKMGRIFRNKNIEVLDISYNPLISHRGIETLHRMRSLKEIKIKGTKAAEYQFLELLISCFNDLVPNCRFVCQ